MPTFGSTAPMDIGQVKGAKGKCKKGKGKKDTVETIGVAQTDNSYFAGECGYCRRWRHKKAHCRDQTKDQGGKLPAATFQILATVSQIQSFPSDDDSFWMFVASAWSGRNARILVAVSDQGWHRDT